MRIHSKSLSDRQSIALNVMIRASQFVNLKSHQITILLPMSPSPSPSLSVSVSVRLRLCLCLCLCSALQTLKSKRHSVSDILETWLRLGQLSYKKNFFSNCTSTKPSPASRLLVCMQFCSWTESSDTFVNVSIRRSCIALLCISEGAHLTNQRQGCKNFSVGIYKNQPQPSFPPNAMFGPHPQALAVWHCGMPSEHTFSLGHLLYSLTSRVQVEKIHRSQ